MEPASGKRSACLLACLLAFGKLELLPHWLLVTVTYIIRDPLMSSILIVQTAWDVQQQRRSLGLPFHAGISGLFGPVDQSACDLWIFFFFLLYFLYFLKQKKNVKCETCLHHLVKRHTHTRRGKARHTHAVRRWWIRLVVSHLALSLFRPAAPAFDLTSRQADRQAKKRWRNEN